MTEQPVDVESAGQNVVGEVSLEEPDAVTDGTTVHDDDTELERTIGIVGGLAIGIGTMMGAVAATTSSPEGWGRPTGQSSA